MRVKILASPKEREQINKINPFSVPAEFRYGGALENRGSQNGVPIRAIDTYSDFLRQPQKEGGPKNPYAATGKNLPDMPKDEADIVVEKQEKIMGDFNGDGMPVLMGVNTGSHASGNDQGINVPDGSFVFSDTPSLKIKDPQTLQLFGMSKSATPAQIAKKYDLQKYKAILDDPTKGEVEKNTAKLMYGNFVNKLNLLASTQEDMKQKQEALKQQRNPYNAIASYMQQGGSIDTKDETTLPGFTVTAKKRQPFRFDQTTPPVEGDSLIPYVNYFPESLQQIDTPSFSQTPYNLPVPQTLPEVSLNDIQSLAGEKKSKSKNNWGSIKNSLTNPYNLAAIATGMRVASYPGYNPIRQVAHGAVPQAVFLDPTRAKAALQESVNSASNAIAMGANGPVARANILALQGKTAPQAANIEAEYAQQNAQIANRQNEQAAQMYNQLWNQQQSFNKDYAEEVHNAQMDKLGYQTSVQNDLIKQSFEADNRKRTAANYNLVNPFYTMDSRGYIYAKGDEQLKALNALDNKIQRGPGNSSPIQDAQSIIKSGNYSKETQDAIMQKAAMMQLYHMQGPKVSKTVDPRTGMPKSTRYSGYEDEFDGTFKKGGSVKKTKVKIVGLP